jgi:dynein heavy chain 2
LLTLPNGERIAFEDNVNFIFETHDLRWASPATISRMGMMFLSNEDINTKSLVDHWIRSLPEDRRELFQRLFEEKFEKCLNLLWKNENNMVVETTRVGTIKNVLSFLKEVQNKEEFQFRVSQGVLSNISIAKHADVLKELNSIFGNELKSLDYQIANGRLEPLQYNPDGKIIITDDSIPCVRTVKTLSKIEMIKCWVKNNQPFIVAGSEGCGKEMVIQQAFNSIRNDVRLKQAIIHCNSQINAKQIIDK